MEPYEQGALDGLCGVYSIVNASRKVLGLTEKQSEDLFHDIAEHLGSKGLMSKVLCEGLGLWLMGEIFQDVVGDRIERRLPFWKNSHARLDAYWETMTDFTAEPGPRAIIIGLDGVYEHWTTIDRITPKQMALFDSDGLKRLHRSRLTIGRPTNERKHQINITLTQFLTKAVA